MKQKIKQRHIDGFEEYLRREERSENTITSYVHNVREFNEWLEGKSFTMQDVLGWRDDLEKHFAATTVNLKLAAVNAFFKYRKWYNFHVKFLKVQRKTYRKEERNLSKKEFDNLLKTANRLGKKRTAMLLETLLAIGIRVSAVQFITVEAAKNGEVEITLKGKTRTIMLPSKLSRKLLKYAKEQGITSGPIFITRTGRCISRKQIWYELKSLCKESGVESSKVFPHNLRHLFARTLYKHTKDVVLLSDMLGHSSIETTRIYLISTGQEHAKVLDELGLVS